MPDRPSSLKKLCAEIRFRGDEPDAGGASTPRGIADFVARIRSSALLVTERSVPKIHQVVDRVRESLGMRRALEVYVHNDPSCNAYAPAFGDADCPVVVLHSGLVTTLSERELHFAIGHELGHLGCAHGPSVHSAESGNELTALRARSRKRHMEISADRVGLLATRSVYVSAGVMVRLASGLPGELLGLDIPGFVRQIERDPEEMSREWELDQTHPSLPFRLWALVRFSASATYQRLSGHAGGGIPIEEVDTQILARMERQGDGRLSRMEEEACTLALVWVGTSLVMEDEVIDARERAALIQLVGRNRAAKAIAFAEAHGKQAVETKLDESIERLASATVATRRRFEQATRTFAMSLDHNAESRIQALAQRLRLR